MSPLFAAVRRAALLCVPFAAVLVAGVALSPHADAQYPGGGSPPGPLGWLPQPRPGVANPTVTGDYDWTGLSGNLTLTPFSGPPLLLPDDELRRRGRWGQQPPDGDD